MTMRENETQGSGAEPPVIDLEAEEVAGAAETATPDAPPPEPEIPPPAPRKKHPVRSIAIAGLAVVAILAGAVAYRSFGERLWPSGRSLAMEERLAALDATTRTLNNQVTGLGAALDELKTANSAASERIDEASSTAHSAADQMKALDRRLAQAETGLKAARDAISAIGSSTTGSSGTGVPPAELEALAARVSALEDAVAALKSAPPSPLGGNAETAALSQALADLKAKLVSGAPYEAEAHTIARLAPGIAALDMLLPYAASGLPTPPMLANEIKTIGDGLPDAKSPAEASDSGFWGTIDQLLGSVVTVKTIGEIDWKDLCAKAAADAGAGRLAEAIARLDDSETALPPELAQWRGKAKARLGADAAIEDVSTAVLRVLSTSPGKS